jgi:hypothetical protein
MRNWMLGYVVVGTVVALTVYFSYRRKNSSTFVEAVLRNVRGPIPAKHWLQSALVNTLAFLAIAAVWPGVLFVEWRKRRVAEQLPEDEPEFECQEAHLVMRVDPSLVESGHHVHDPLRRVPDVAFGHLHATWRDFREQVRAGDEVCSFHIPAYWRLGALPTGQMSGYVIRRGGRIVAEFAFEGC